MTQQEYENELKELKKRIENLEMAKVEEPQSKRWTPKDGENYYVVDSHGDATICYWEDDKFDEWQYLIGNCFKIEEEAEEYKKQIEYTARYKNYIEEHSEPIDWSDEEQDKWSALFDFTENIIAINPVTTSKYQGEIHASSEQIIKDAIKEIGEDNFKKYVLGVK